MSYSVLVSSTMLETLPTILEPNEVMTCSAAVQQTTIEMLNDNAIRREVYNEAVERLDDIDMMIVHAIMDALVTVVRGG